MLKRDPRSEMHKAAIKFPKNAPLKIYPVGNPVKETEGGNFFELTRHQSGGLQQISPPLKTNSSGNGAVQASWSGPCWNGLGG